jgi:hypothetical protein
VALARVLRLSVVDFAAYLMKLSLCICRVAIFLFVGKAMVNLCG